jgi:hypothetical protein
MPFGGVGLGGEHQRLSVTGEGSVDAIFGAAEGTGLAVISTSSQEIG